MVYEVLRGKAELQSLVLGNREALFRRQIAVPVHGTGVAGHTCIANSRTLRRVSEATGVGKLMRLQSQGRIAGHDRSYGDIRRTDTIDTVRAVLEVVVIVASRRRQLRAGLELGDSGELVAVDDAVQEVVGEVRLWRRENVRRVEDILSADVEDRSVLARAIVLEAARGCRVSHVLGPGVVEADGGPRGRVRQLGLKRIVLGSCVALVRGDSLVIRERTEQLLALCIVEARVYLINGAHDARIKIRTSCSDRGRGHGSDRYRI